MSNQDELFLLIKGMSKNEKGYFRKFNGIHGSTGDGNCQKLFDCMAGMKEYDEQLIRSRLKGEKILSHLNVTRHRLKNLVIRALRNYQEDSVPYISNLMSQADAYVMLNRGLYQTAGNKILKEKETAKTSDNFLSALQWIDLHDRFLYDTYHVTEMKEKAANIWAEKQTIAAQYANYSGYKYLLNLLAPMSSNTIGSGELRELRTILKHRLLSTNVKPLSAVGRINYTDVLMRIYWLKNDRAKGIKLLKESISYFDNSQQSTPSRQLFLYHWLLNFMGRDEATEMRVIIFKMINILLDKKNGLNESSQRLYQSYVYSHEMRMESLHHNPESMLRSAHKLELHYKKFPAGIDEEIPLWMLMSIAYVQLRQFGKALVQVNKIFNHKPTEQDRHLLDAYLLNIIIHLELRNYSILKRQFTLAENFAKKNYSDTHCVWLILSRLGQVAKAIEDGDDKTRRTKARYFLQALRTKNIPDKEYLEDWLETLK